MTDNEFVDEVAARITRFLQEEPQRAHITLMAPLTHAGYANVGHWLGQLCLPKGVGMDTDPESLNSVKFLVPTVNHESKKIEGFESLTGAELKARAEQAEQNSEKG